MNGTLRRIEKELRNIAKRYKNIKYSKVFIAKFSCNGGIFVWKSRNF